MEFWRSVGGLVDVELVSAQPEVMVEVLNHNAVEVFEISQKDPLTWRFRLLQKDCRAAAALTERHGGKLSILRLRGLYWLGKQMLSRPVLTVGLGLLLCVCLFLPTRVLFVRVDGNRVIPSRKILAAAEDCGIRFLASRKEVRSEQMKNALLSAVPQLKWAGVNTSGCVATISVREKIGETEDRQQWPVQGLAALRDGYILSATATRGNLLVQPGQTVKKGQLLISGFTDRGICIRFTGAQGEVFAQTVHEIEAVTPAQWWNTGEERGRKKKYSLLFGKKRINLWKDSGISDSSCGRMYEEYYVTLPGGFRLPIALCVDTCIDYERKPAKADPELLRKPMKSFASACLSVKLAAGKILSRQEQFVVEEDLCRLTGTYVCTEMIATGIQEQIGDTNGKNS